MAAFHFSAKIHSRTGGARSAVRAAAYRAAERIYDERVGESCDYTAKSDVFRSEIFAPAGAAAWVFDRAKLWNAVEARERRKDAQLAQEYELNLPRELSHACNWDILTQFVRSELIAKGRIADVSMHCARASDGEAHPHAHILMPMRLLQNGQLGGKHPDVDRKTFYQNRHRIEELREAWCEFVRERAAERGFDLGPNWDHRTLEARGIDLKPLPKIGAAAARREEQLVPADRVSAYHRTLTENGQKLLADPSIALKALTVQASTFTDHDLARWIHRHCNEEQFVEILAGAKASAIFLGKDPSGRSRYSTAEMIEIERRMMADATALAGNSSHVVRRLPERDAASADRLSEEQRAAAQQILTGGDLTALVGYAGAGKSTMLAEVRRAFACNGYNIIGAALSGIAAQNLELGSQIESRTLASWSHGWASGREALTSKDVVIVDEAGMIGSRQLGQLLKAVRAAGAKVVLVGDAEQLQAIEAGAAFRSITERFGSAQLSTVHRQQEGWQREATREFATGQTEAALARYQEAGRVVAAAGVDEARRTLVGRWLQDRSRDPAASQLILAHTRADVRAINDEAREALQRTGEVGPSVEIDTSRGIREFGAGDRFLFLRNNRDLGVKNGTLAWVEAASQTTMVVITDDGKRVSFDPRLYTDFDHGYAVTVHKSQGVTVDRSYVLGTTGFDRHLAYVALSRHRLETSLVYSAADFATTEELKQTFARERAKDTTLDYIELMESRACGEPDIKARRPSFGDLVRTIRNSFGDRRSERSGQASVLDEFAR